VRGVGIESRRWKGIDTVGRDRDSRKQTDDMRSGGEHQLTQSYSNN